MTKPNEQYAYFSITGSFDPADITARVGVEPTECWRQGDLNPRNRLGRKFSRWCLYSRLSRERELEAHVRDVLSQLDARREAFRQAAGEFDGSMQLVGYFYTGYPGLHFERDVVKEMAAFGLSIDFDFYELYSDRREDT